MKHSIKTFIGGLLAATILTGPSFAETPAETWAIDIKTAAENIVFWAGTRSDRDLDAIWMTGHDAGHADALWKEAVEGVQVATDWSSAGMAVEAVHGIVDAGTVPEVLAWTTIDMTDVTTMQWVRKIGEEQGRVVNPLLLELMAEDTHKRLLWGAPTIYGEEQGRVVAPYDLIMPVLR